ncbi:MAG: hypothetical protein ACREMY_27975 [bacterium]
MADRLKAVKFACPFVNSADEQYVVVVELARHEIADAMWELERLGPNGPGGPDGPVAKAYALRAALRSVPRGFRDTDLVLDTIRRVPPIH